LTDIDAVGAIRDQLAGLLSQIDSSAKPRPDKLNPPDHRLPGPEWHPEKRLVRDQRAAWIIRCIDNDPTPPTCIFITSPESVCDTDFSALPTEDARKLAMAILAACDWADGLAAGATQLDKRRPA
jgi:hypothetical protein